MTNKRFKEIKRLLAVETRNLEAISPAYYVIAGFELVSEVERLRKDFNKLNDIEEIEK